MMGGKDEEEGKIKNRVKLGALGVLVFLGFLWSASGERRRETFGLCRVPEAHESRRKLQETCTVQVLY